MHKLSSFRRTILLLPVFSFVVQNEAEIPQEEIKFESDVAKEEKTP
jgi:hypothetical protein